MMVLRARDNNIQCFASIRLNFRMLKEFVLISFVKPDVRKTLNIIKHYRVRDVSHNLMHCTVCQIDWYT